ncbi:MAG: hypothetical protein VKI81_09430 [Synechococcaceae cyanobacterium]|nr:hypothetical protein [Synechococcaceae cyanobacterium]
MKRPPPRMAALVVAGLQSALLLGVAGQLLLERALSPRGWARTEPVDPSLPIRGRYVTLRLVVPAAATTPACRLLARRRQVRPVWLGVRDGRVVASSVGSGGNPRPARLTEGADGAAAHLRQPLAFFVPPGVKDPSRRGPGEELWAEVTLPAEGPPRPIRLGVKRGDRIEPLALR